MREADIRPAGLLATYLRLSAEDAKIFFPDPAQFITRDCPGCGADNKSFAFDKNGFDLVACAECGSLFVDPVPTTEALAKFYRDSPSQQFWAEEFFPAVAEARRENIFRDRVHRLQALIAEDQSTCEIVIDVGAGAGIFLEECRSAGLGKRHVAVEPSVDLAAMCRRRGLQTVEGMVEEVVDDPAIAGTASLVTCFEVIEHVFSPADLLRSLAALCRPGGRILVTGLCGTGFDILVLGARSNAVSPPHHLNFLSRDGAKVLMGACGLIDTTFLTPGKLDVDIVCNSIKDGAPPPSDPFVRHLLNGDEPIKAAFQEFLADNGLSSHMWLFARSKA
ncbi:MAG: SAM-dependent methyltransferase [Magnetovibrio sp.]|nr:SAM-dependent methyltransferase [Magnetovibrio sp.]